MREGTRTVLSMQNNYQGPPEDFAMVVPVPVVLHKEDVKTLPTDVFEHVDTLARRASSSTGSRIPCQPPMPPMQARRASAAMAMRRPRRRRGRRRDLGVKIEAQFAVGEYEIVILSAKDSTGLETWLRQEQVQDPRGRARGAGALRRAAGRSSSSPRSTSRR